MKAPHLHPPVDRFLQTFVGSRALKTALDLGLIDDLHMQLRVNLADLQHHFPDDPRGLMLLVHILIAQGVLEKASSDVSLTAAFREALPYRDLLEAKIDLADLVAPDLLELMPMLLTDPAGFQKLSRLFGLFGYQHALEMSEVNRQRTAAWMRYTTCLTRYEAQAFLHDFDISHHRRLLDIGGNSGEFALRLCQAHPDLAATIFDLPVVCEVGQEHVKHEPEASRLHFHQGSALVDPLPAGFDLVTFKSMLHDWPGRDAERLLTRASQALAPGGTLAIFERGPFTGSENLLAYGQIPMLLFYRSFRSPELYTKHLEAIGFADVKVRWLELDMPFFLVTAKLGEAAGKGE